MRNDLHYEWPDIGSVDIEILGNDHATLRFSPSKEIIEKATEGHKEEEGYEHLQFLNLDAKTKSRAFSEILRHVHEDVIDQESRDVYYQHFSEEYNDALREGRFGDALVYLMMMRIIIKAEGLDDDAENIAFIADKIIWYAMIDIEKK